MRTKEGVRDMCSAILPISILDQRIESSLDKRYKIREKGQTRSEWRFLIYERTGKCPYTDRCEHYQLMLRIENQLLMDRRDTALTRNSAEWDEYDRIMESYQKKLEHLSRAMIKCNEQKGRCLRFWKLVNELAPEEAVSPDVTPHA